MSTIYAQYPIKGASGGGGGGTVTSVGLTGSEIFSIMGSPITTSGTLDIELANEPANTFLAGPTMGSAAPPTFRAIVNADLASITTLADLSLPVSQLSGTLLTTQGGTGLSAAGTSGNVLTSNGIAWVSMAPATSGTVTSVSVTSGNGFAGTVSNPTTMPGIEISTTVTGILYGNGTSVATAVAGNFPTLNQSTTGTAANITATSNSTLTTLSALSLPGSQVTGNISGNAANVTGIVAPANGGTGIANNAASTLTISGNFGTTLTVGATTALTLPASGTVATLHDAQGSPLMANNSLSASVASNALTISLNDVTGATPTSTSQVSIAFRDPTAATGTVHIRTVSSSTTIVIPSGTTIGTVSGLQQWLYVYAMDNAGTVVLAVSLSNFDEGSVQSSSAISGGAASSVLYSTSAQSSLAVRYLGRMSIKETTAGTWATGPTEISSIPANQFSSINFQTAGYNVVESDQIIMANASGGNITVTLPTAIGILGKQFTIKKTDTSTSTHVSIGTTSSQTIDGVTGVNLYTAYETLTLVSNGTNWNTLVHIWPSGWLSYSPTSQGLGTISSSMFYRRVGDSVEIMGTFTTGTVTAAQAQLELPNGWASDSNKVPSTRTCGIVNSGAAGANSYYALIEQNVSYLTFGVQNSATAGTTEQLGSNIFGSSTTYHITSCTVPIGGWFG